MSIAAKVIKLEVYLEDANLYVAEDIEAGGIITEQNVRSVRLGYGLHTKYLKDVIGKKAVMDLGKGIPLNFKMIG